MKSIRSILYKTKVAIFAIAMLLISSRCSLDEGVYSIFTPDTFYKTDKEVLSSLSGVYRNFAAIPSFGSEYRIIELSADQLMVFGRTSNAWDDPNTQTLMLHTWTEANPLFNTTWNTLYATVAQANSLIPILEGTTTITTKGPIAELRCMRAYAYFYLMDLFGNVPIYTKPAVDPHNLPSQNTSAEVFNFITQELIEAAADLPSQKTVSFSYYGRLTQEAAYALLATVYLNAKVYTGTEHSDEAITYADLVINSNAYSLLPNYFDNFKYNNESSKEYIFGAVYTPNIAGGPGQSFVQKCLPAISGQPGTTTGLFDLPYVPQNGFGTRPAVISKYENIDERKSMFFPAGTSLKDPRNGNVVMVEKIEGSNTSVLYQAGKSKTGPVPYALIPSTGTRGQANNQGDMWVKWGFDPATNGGVANNDVALLRYADILLIKAEALARKGNFGDALPLVNEVRKRSKATELVTLTLDDILDERGRELVFELTRRRDLIRFGKFNDAWQFKEASESFRTLFPIPSLARGANSKLEKNPGY